MGRYIAKLAEDAYCDWSTVVDAPVSWVVPRDSAVAEWGEDRVARADRNGTSIVDGYPAGETPEQIVAANRAGPRETTLTVTEIIAMYDVNSPDPRLVAQGEQHPLEHLRPNGPVEAE